MTARICLVLAAVALACSARQPEPAAPARTVDLPPAAQRAPEPETVPAPARPRSPELMLADDHARRFSGRVQVARFHHARLRPEAEDIAADEARPVHAASSVYVAVDQAPERVRIVTEAHAVRLLAWVPRDELRWVVVRRDRLETRLGAADGAWVHPGLALDVEESTKTHRRVEHTSNGIAISGWLRSSSTGHVYVPIASSALPSLAVDASLAAGARVTATPGGAAIAHFEDGVSVQRVGDPIAGHQKIRYRARAHGRAELGGFELEGFVQTADVITPPRLGDVHGFGSSGGWGGSHALRVAPGTRLFDEPDGELVGIVVGEAMAYWPATIYGWMMLELPTPWGFVKLYAPPDSERPR